MEDFAAIQSLPNLAHLSIDISAIVDRDEGYLPKDLSTLAKLTHLELFGNVYPAIVPPLSTLPALTHLSFYNRYFPNVIRSILVSCNSTLRILVQIDGGNLYDDDDFDVEIAETTIDDPRFVPISCMDFQHDWLNGAWGGTDYWSRAEEIVAARPPKRDIDPHVNHSTF
ncbi:hypothetical protein C8F01DRAFT_1147588 [Mycena amicta]|nr:hypothetical protein C8F01DRAFT_1147588 [Mycena amicta]